MEKKKVSLKGMSAEELIAFYDTYLKKHAIFDPEQRRRIWFAMFYRYKEGGSWDF